MLGAHISQDGQWCFPPSDHVPDKFAECIIRYEDKRFKWHSGVDMLSAGRALVQNVREGEVVSGASTITMQVIRMSRPDKRRTIAEKLYEMLLARRLELRCSKREILLLYASNAPFGGNVIGLEAAAWRYFGRSADELSWAESAMLAVLPNSPALIHPGRNRERLLDKRNRLLDKLVEAGVIDGTECLLAKDEPLPDKPLPMPDNAYHLLERGIREYGGGRLASTIDYDLQCRVNAIARNYHETYRTNLVDNMGILVIEIATGDIVAYYGNTRSCGRAVRSSDVDMIPAARSSGSTLKPMLYAAMIQSGDILPGSLVKDTPYTHDNFTPHNYSRTFDGAVPAHEVIERSLNVPSVRLLERFGAPEFLSLLRQMGFDTINKPADHYGLSLILGGAEISLYTLARAYYYMAAKLSDVPVVRSPGYVSHSSRQSRREMLDPDSLPLSKAAVWLTFDALSNAGRPEEESSWMSYSSARRIAWKTGTSWGDRDAWSVGVSSGHVVAVWVGNSDGEGRAMMTGVSYAAPVMFDVFSCLPSDGWFEMPVDEMARVEVCHESGMPPSAICPHRDTIWAPSVEHQPEVCRYHRLVHLDPTGSWQVNSDCCPVDQMRTECRFVLPPAQEWYYRRKHLDYIPLPPKHPLFDSSAAGANPIEIVYPQHGTTIVSTRGLDGKMKGAVFKAVHSDPDAVLYWHLDDEFLGQTSGEHQLMVAPLPGEHQLTVLDGSGARRTLRFFAE